MRLEHIILKEVTWHGMKPHAFDLAVWSWYSSSNKGMPVLAGQVAQPRPTTAAIASPASGSLLPKNDPDGIGKGLGEEDITVAVDDGPILGYRKAKLVKPVRIKAAA